MKIVAFSDTHGDARASKAVFNANPDADCFFFLGDGTREASLTIGKGKTPCHIVTGNCDIFSDYPYETVADIDGVRFLLCHGDRYSISYSDERLLMRARELGADAVVYGHTHVVCSRLVPVYGKELWLICPGSAARPRDGQPSYSVITLSNGAISVSQVRFSY